MRIITCRTIRVIIITTIISISIIIFARLVIVEDASRVLTAAVPKGRRAATTPIRHRRRRVPDRVPMVRQAFHADAVWVVGL